MYKNSRKFLKVLALLLCEANNIGGMKSSASGNGNLQLITQNTKNINKVNKENTNLIKQNPIKALLFTLLGIAGLSIGGALIHNYLVNNDEPTFDEKNVIFDNSEILKIIEDLKKKAPEIQKASKNQDYSKFKTTWEGLSYLLGEDATKFVEENYPEWKERLSKNSYKNWQYYYGYESFALMSMAFTLRLAALKKYQHDDIKNNELLLGENLPNFTLKPCNNDGNIRKKRLEKVIVEDNDILRSAHKFLLEHPDYLSVKIGFLNAGDPYDPNGFLPNHGSALEEYLSMNTSLVRDLSGKEFRKGQGKQGFYTTRQDFPPVCNWGESSTIDTVRERLTGPGRDFYHQRGIMSRNVYLIRNLGDCNKNDYKNDSSFPFNVPNKYSAEFNPPKDGLGAIKFCILSIAGLEDRTKPENEKILNKYGKLSISKDNKKGATVYQTWEKITKTQCEFVLKAFIKEGVRVPFLCAFGAGCFGGKASMVAKCFRELLIDKGYIDRFDRVVFPIGYDKNNFKAFESEFCKK